MSLSSKPAPSPAREVVELGPRDAIRVAPQSTRAFETRPDGLELIAVGARHEDDGEVIQGWWDA